MNTVSQAARQDHLSFRRESRLLQGLSIHSPIRMSQPPFKTVEQPVLSDKSIVKRNADTDYSLSLYRNLRTAFFQGGHHLHMEKPPQVAD